MKFRYVFLGVCSYYVLTEIERLLRFPRMSLVFTTIALVGGYAIYKRMKNNQEQKNI